MVKREKMFTKLRGTISLTDTSDCRGAFFAAVPGASQGMLKHAKQFQQAAKTAPAQSRGPPGLREKVSYLQDVKRQLIISGVI